jgi:hypothetical protein
MTTLKVNAIEPEGGTTNLTVGLSGQNVVIGGSGGLKANTFKDAGGNTLWTSDGSGNISSVSTQFGGAQVLIQSQTASNSASLSFTSGITSTYKEYIFEFININPATDEQSFQFQANASGQSGYNEVISSNHIRVFHQEDNGGTPTIEYWTAGDQGNGTGYQYLSDTIGNGADESLAGELHLFNPANTTYVTHWYSTTQMYHRSDRTFQSLAAGYFNVTAAITNIQFNVPSGNFDGKIKMYGVK